MRCMYISKRDGARYELKHGGAMHPEHIKGHLEEVWNASKYHEENNSEFIVLCDVITTQSAV